MTDRCVRWINMRGQADVADGRHAEKAENVYLDRGVVRKRNGYRQTVKFDGAINGVFDVRIGGQAYVLVYAGTRFFLREKDREDCRENYRDITLSGAADYRVRLADLEDRPIAVYEHEDRAYVVGCGDYLVLKRVGDSVELRRVEDEEDTYVPTTAVGIRSETRYEYREATVDEDSVGVFYVRVGENYEKVDLDGETVTPQTGVTYYRRIELAQEGRKAEQPNMLTGWRKNTLYGTPAGTATYRLDAQHADPDGQVEIEVDREENGAVRHYSILSRRTGTMAREPVTGDDLSGVQLSLVHTSISGVESLHFLPSKIGFYEINASGGYLRWQSSSITSSGWNTAVLVLKTASAFQVVGVASRESIFADYTVTFYENSITFPSDFGVVSSIGDVFAQTEAFGTLPVLTSELLCGAEVWGEVDYRNATITFTEATTAPTDQDNIVVRYKYRDERYNAEKIGKGRVSVVYGVGGNRDRLFVSGEEKNAAVDYHSESGEWTYFAPDGYCKLSTSGTVATYLATHDGLLTVVKNGSGPNAFWRVGEWVTEQTEIDGDVYRTKRAVFALTRTATLPKPSADGTAGYLDSDVLYLAENGLYRVMTNALTDDKKAMRLSAPIEGVLFGEESRATVHDLRYYASNGREVFVGDSRYRLAMDSDSNYEWTKYAIEGVRVWYTSGDALSFGTVDGRLCTFGEDYEDVTFEDTEEGQLTVDASDGSVTFDEALAVEEGDEFYLNQSVYAVLATPLDVGDGCVYVDSEAILHVYEDEEVRLAIGGTLGDSVYVKDVDWGKCRFALADENGQAVAIAQGVTHVVCDLKGRKVTATAPEDCACGLKMADGSAVTVYGGALPSVLTARIVKRKPVCAVYASCANALDTPDITKVLKSVTVEVESRKDGKATLAVRTSLTQNEREIFGINALRYDWLDFAGFTFDGDFPRAYTVRCKARFHNLTWKIESNNAGDMAIRGVCLRYGYLQPAKGVSD